MKHRLLLRTKDWILPEKNPLFEWCDSLPSFKSKSNPIDLRGHQGIGYQYMEDIVSIPSLKSGKTTDYSHWDLYFTGITLPKYGRIMTNNLVRDAFGAIMNQEGLDYRFTYDRKNNSPSILGFDGAIECDSVAKKVINVYVDKKDELSATLKQIDNIYPITWDECSQILNTLRGR